MKTGLTLGYTDTGSAVIYDWARDGNMLIAGRAGTGKTHLLRAMVGELAASGADIVICDTKAAEYRDMAGTARVVDDVAAVRRMLADWGTASMSGPQPSRRVIVIDELADIMAGNDDAVVGAFRDICLNAAARLIVATSRPRPDTVPDALGWMFPIRVVFQTRTPAESERMLGAPVDDIAAPGIAYVGRTDGNRMRVTIP